MMLILTRIHWINQLSFWVSDTLAAYKYNHWQNYRWDIVIFSDIYLFVSNGEGIGKYWYVHN